MILAAIVQRAEILGPVFIREGEVVRLICGLHHEVDKDSYPAVIGKQLLQVGVIDIHVHLKGVKR